MKIKCNFVKVSKTKGLGVFSSAIIDEPKNLIFIQKAMLHPDFLKLMSFSDGYSGVGGQRYNYKVISLFRKDFWKEFLILDE